LSRVVEIAFAAGLLLAAGVSLYGWGSALRRLSTIPRLSWPVTIALGIAAVVAVGGALNLARIAYAPLLWIVAALGLLFAAMEMKSARPWQAASGLAPDARREAGLAGAFITAVMVFAIATLLPSAIFNYHDDFEKYFAHPVRMLATGTVLGSPLSVLGQGMLGGMAFLHGFVLSAFPFDHLNAVDQVFGLGLLLCLGAAAGWRRLGAVPGALLVAAALASIEPQHVNISALYLGSALMAAAVLLAVEAPGLPSPLALGLLYGGLVALKSSFAPFVPLHLLLLAIAAPEAVRDRLRWAFRAALWSGAALAPWLLVHLPHYLSPATAKSVIVPEGSPDPLHFLSVGQMIWGPAPAYYTLLAALGLATGLLAAWTCRKGGAANERRRPAAAVLACALAGSGSCALLVAMTGPIFPVEASVRYAIPFLLGTVPFAIALSPAALPAPLAAARGWLPAAALLGVTVLFVPSLLGRAQNALRHHSIIAYLTEAGGPRVGTDYYRDALSDSAARRMRSLQALVPAGEPVIVWVIQAYHLDFARNQIFDVDVTGFINRWARTPSEARYVIWEYDGAPVRPLDEYIGHTHNAGRMVRVIFARALGFAQELELETRDARILYRDERFVVFERPPRAGTERVR
jgi:hypothetical protein